MGLGDADEHARHYLTTRVTAPADFIPLRGRAGDWRFPLAFSQRERSVTAMNLAICLPALFVLEVAINGAIHHPAP